MKNKNNISRVTVVYALFTLVLIIFAYKELPLLFLQQDEWMSLGGVFTKGVLGNMSQFSVFEIAAGKERFLGSLINDVFHFYFPLDIRPFVIFSIVFHWLNTLLLFLLAKRLFTNVWTAVISGCMFAVSSVSHQAISWFAANTTTLPCATFALLSVYWYLSSFEKRYPMRYVLLSLGALIVSFLFKESSVFLFFLLPLIGFLHSEKRMVHRNNIVSLLLFVVWAMCIVVIRFGTRSASYPSLTAQSSTISPLLSIGIKAIFLPLFSFSQLFIPSVWLVKIAQVLQPALYAFFSSNVQKDALIQIVLLDELSLLITSVLFVCTMGFFILFQQARKNIAVLLLWVFTSLIPYAVAPRALSAYLDSRYYYVPMIGGALLVGYLSYLFYMSLGKLPGKIILRCVSVLLLCLFLYKHTQFISRYVKADAIVASERKSFLKQIKKLVPHPSDNVIFFIEGDSPGFYGIPNLAVPFQNGLGYILMVYYYRDGSVPDQLINDKFLWNINEQGYRFVSDKGFGFFWSAQELQKALSTAERTPEVIHLRYIASEKRLVREVQ